MRKITREQLEYFFSKGWLDSVPYETATSRFYEVLKEEGLSTAEQLEAGLISPEELEEAKEREETRTCYSGVEMFGQGLGTLGANTILSESSGFEWAEVKRAFEQASKGLEKMKECLPDVLPKAIDDNLGVIKIAIEAKNKSDVRHKLSDLERLLRDKLHQ